VTQNIVFFSGTLKENVAYGQPGISDDVVIDALKRANAWDFVRELKGGIQTNMGADGIKFSGGQQQRLAIARALVRDPRVLILDEATSALDLESEGLVMDALVEVMRGRTSFLVSHRMSLVADADLVAVMERGRITDLAAPAELARYDNFFSMMMNKARG
jgi:ATP-binding cassette subfamily B protein